MSRNVPPFVPSEPRPTPSGLVWALNMGIVSFGSLFLLTTYLIFR